MKNDTQKEIGELIEEITVKGFQLNLDVDDSEFHRAVQAEAWNEETTPFTVLGATSIVEALGLIVDMLRKHRGEPSRAEELEAMLAADASHADAPPVNIGPDASCGCGSRKPLQIKRPMLIHACWYGYSFWDNPKDPCDPKPGEIGTCPDCGRNYTFGPA